MLTLFSTPKPFRGHVGITQRNAIRSWTLLHPKIEIILFGDEEGCAEVSAEFGVHHEPYVKRSSLGTKYLNYIFDRAQELAHHPLVCYVNCDIFLMSDFREALQHVSKWKRNFLMVGRRWDIDIVEPWHFDDLDWELRLRSLALRERKQRHSNWIDYFAFPRWIYYKKIPPFVIGRVGWDNWLLWAAWSSKIPVVDASAAILAVHQNHDYSYHPGGEKGVWKDEESKENYKLAGTLWHLHSIENATHKLKRSTIQYNWRHWPVLLRQDAVISWGMIKAAPRALGRIKALLRGRRRA